MLIHQPMTLRLQITLIYFCLIVLGSLQMLLVMTFNVGILIAIVAGQVVGFIVVPKNTKITEGLSHELEAPTNLYKPDADACCKSCC